MKLYPLLLGRTKVPFGQFYGGLNGWEGFGALFRFVTDKKHFIWVPIHAYLLEHPKEGLILVDAGILILVAIGVNRFLKIFWPHLNGG